jgi:hypothetical protein
MVMAEVPGSGGGYIRRELGHGALAEKALKQVVGWGSGYFSWWRVDNSNRELAHGGRALLKQKGGGVYQKAAGS